MRPDVDPLSIPVEQGLHGEAVAQVMDPGRARAAGEPDLGTDRPERLGEGLVGEAALSAPGEEHRRRRHSNTERSSRRHVGVEGTERARGERNEATLVELPQPHDEDPLFPVDVAQVEGEDLPDPHAGHGEQAEDRLDGGGPVRRFEGACDVEQGGDVGSRVQVGHSPGTSPGREEPARWHLVAGTLRLEVAGEPPDQPQPPGHATFGARRLARPGERQCDGDRVRAAVIEVTGEVGEDAVDASELEPDGATQGHVVMRGVGEGAHRPLPGQGLATVASAARSTLA